VGIIGLTIVICMLLGYIAAVLSFIMWKSRNKALRDNPELKILYEGPILGEDGYESKRP
jgi:uncharacterized protein YneF (UPF0154 family)